MNTQTKQILLKPVGSFPPWMTKILEKQMKMNARYEKAMGLFAESYNDLLLEISEINSEYGTEFSIEQAIYYWQGGYAPVDDEADNDNK